MKDEIAELKEIVNTHRREESERANQARINQMQAEMDKKEATIQELKDSGAGENLRSLTEKQEQLEQMMLYMQRSLSSSSGISSASYPDSGISPSPSSSRVEMEEKLSLSMMQMNLVRTTNTSEILTPPWPCHDDEQSDEEEKDS